MLRRHRRPYDSIKERLRQPTHILAPKRHLSPDSGRRAEDADANASVLGLTDPPGGGSRIVRGVVLRG